MITRATLSTIEQGLPKYRSMLAGNDAFIPSSFDSIATATGTGSAATVTFNSIPSTYQHLQLRGIFFPTSVSGTSVSLAINGATATYRYHYFSSNGTGVEASGGTSTSIRMINQSGLGSTTYPVVFVIDILDYTSTSKNKVTRHFLGADSNNTGSVAGSVELSSGLWVDTTSITSLTIGLAGSGNLSSTSQVALYGIKGS